MGGLGWIDFSPDHRARVATVLELLKPEGRVDELGIGVIRDALSDSMFPGISTIQTRAKYFLIVPRIFKEYQTRYTNKNSRPKLQDYLRERENHIIRTLAEKYKDDEEPGIYGITLVGTRRELVRKPSSIYWTGLRLFRIIRTDLSLTEYLAQHDRQQSIIELLAATEERKGDDGDAGYDDAFGISLPDGNQQWDRDLTIDLSDEEAGFLRDKIIDHHGDKLIGQVLKEKSRMARFIQIGTFMDMSALFLEKPLPQRVKTILRLARGFDAIIHGAHIRYNCLLQEKYGTREQQNKFEERWQEWRQRIVASGVFGTFDESLLFDLATTLKPETEGFVRNWVVGLRQAKPEADLDRLVIAQERWNKGGKARLRPGGVEKADDWIGIDGLSYRFPVAQTIVRDIRKGLGW